MNHENDETKDNKGMDIITKSKTAKKNSTQSMNWSKGKRRAKPLILSPSDTITQAEGDAFSNQRITIIGTRYFAEEKITARLHDRNNNWHIKWNKFLLHTVSRKIKLARKQQETRDVTRVRILWLDWATTAGNTAGLARSFRCKKITGLF